jgi:hypothetical protein
VRGATKRDPLRRPLSRMMIPSAVRARSLRVGCRASWAMMTSSPLSTLAMSVRSWSTCRNVGRLSSCMCTVMPDDGCSMVNPQDAIPGIATGEITRRRSRYGENPDARRGVARNCQPGALPPRCGHRRACARRTTALLSRPQFLATLDARPGFWCALASRGAFSLPGPYLSS